MTGWRLTGARGGWLAAVFLALLAAAPASASFQVPPNNPGQYAPRDACAAVPDAPAFRARVVDAVRRRDVQAFVALAADDVMLDYGGGAGRKDLRERLSGKDGPGLWQELDALLALGCAFDEGQLVMPWFFAADLGDADPYSTMLVMGASVPLRAGASKGAAIRRRLNWQLVVIPGDYRPEKPFQYVRLIGRNGAGHVASEALRSQIGYRLIAERRAGVWRITAFIAGD